MDLDPVVGVVVNLCNRHVVEITIGGGGGTLGEEGFTGPFIELFEVEPFRVHPSCFVRQGGG